MNGESERGFLGVLDYNAGLTDLWSHHIVFFCCLKNKYSIHDKDDVKTFLFFKRQKLEMHQYWVKHN